MNPLYGLAKATLVQALADTREELLGGSAITQTGAGETSAQLQTFRNLTPERRIELIWTELNRIDPENYPLSAITRYRITTSRFFDL